jgi:hypothetical protein
MSFTNESYRQAVESYIKAGGQVTICPSQRAAGAVPVSRKDTPRRPDWMAQRRSA